MASSFSGSKAKNRARQTGRRREPLSQQFRRLREEDPLVPRRGRAFDEPAVCKCADAIGSLLGIPRSCGDPDNCLLPQKEWDDGDDFTYDWLLYELDHCIHRLISPPPPLLAPAWGAGPVAEQPLPEPIVPEAVVEPRMIEYLTLLNEVYAHLDEVREHIVASVRSYADRRALQAFAGEAVSSEWAKHMCLFSPFWLRRPSSWDGSDGERGLLKHLFSRFDAPEFLVNGFSEGWNHDSFRCLALYIVLSQGGSTRRLAWHLRRVPSPQDPPTPRRGAAGAGRERGACLRRGAEARRRHDGLRTPSCGSGVPAPARRPPRGSGRPDFLAGECAVADRAPGGPLGRGRGVGAGVGDARAH